MKKKIEAVKNDVVLSIRYARLKEEAKLAELRASELADKKNILGLNEKKLYKNKQFLDEVNAAIHRIESNHSSASYSLVVGGKVGEYLSPLSRRKDFELIKYGIAFSSILDDEFEYTDAVKTAFFESISLMLFGNGQAIKHIEENYKRISTSILGGGSRGESPSLKGLARLPADDLLKAAAFLPKKVLGLVSIATLGAGLGFLYLKKRGRAKKLSTMSAEQFAVKLVLIAMNLFYAANHFKSEMDYKYYFRQRLKEINLERKFIMKKLFEEHYEIEENKEKVKLLHNFDNYMIDYIDIRSRKNV